MITQSCIALTILCAGLAQAENKPVELKWSELAAVVTGQNIEFTTKEGVRLRGNVVSVRPEEMVLDAKHTSNPKIFPKGGVTVPRTSVDTLRMIKTKAAWGRSLGTGLGLVAGYTLMVYTARAGGSGTAVLTTLFGITGATTVGGFFLGRAADRKVTIIRIIQ